MVRAAIAEGVAEAFGARRKCVQPSRPRRVARPRPGAEMRAALRDKRRATAIEREVEITLLRAAAMDVWNAVPTGVVLPPEYVQAINRLGCAIRGEWHLLAPVASPVAAVEPIPDAPETTKEVNP